MQSAFLWEPYKPSFWWFEIFETARRLAMTGVLGAISPGSDVQLASGIVMTFGGTMVYCICMPFSELKDNILGILTNAQIFLVMLTAMVMKHNAGGEGEEGVGVLLIFMNLLCVLVFVGFGVVQAFSYKHDFNNNKKSEAGLAMGVLKGNKKKRDEGELPRTFTGESEESAQVEEGCGSSLFAAPRNWLRTISSGAAELGGGVFSREERRKRKEEARRAFEATAPGYTGEPEEPPPPPPGAPPPNNDIFDKLRLQREAAARVGGAVEIELMENPLRKGGAGKSAAAADGAVDGKKLQNLDSFNAQARAKKQQRGGGGGDRA